MGLIDSIIGAESGGNPNASNPSPEADELGSQLLNPHVLIWFRANQTPICSP